MFPSKAAQLKSLNQDKTNRIATIQLNSRLSQKTPKGQNNTGKSQESIASDLKELPKDLNKDSLIEVTNASEIDKKLAAIATTPSPRKAEVLELEHNRVNPKKVMTQLIPQLLHSAVKNSVLKSSQEEPTFSFSNSKSIDIMMKPSPEELKALTQEYSCVNASCSSPVMANDNIIWLIFK
ncbi:hypothetical protein RCL_jg18296.t1 [Rhizophagus clarus]|uniref:Uncharacterized protein n=1 Tax=Rhizophagus clarus TaxID=94130 RepID=A0A8H3QNE2_9GLOM|nr:hypothetical protein RCL_jg18296.t1 [Rhizophagus clarus]